MKKYLTGLLTFLVVGFFLVSARAASVESFAYLDWSNFSWKGISLTDGSDAPTLNWVSQEQSIDLEVQENSHSESANNWSDDLTSQIEVRAEALTNSINSYAHISSGEGYGHGRIERWGQFKVSGSGLIVFTVPYGVEGKIESESSEHVSLHSEVYLKVSQDSDVSRSSFSLVDLYKSQSDAGAGEWENEGILSVALYFNENEIGNFLAGAYAEVRSAPIPSSILLITSGIGLIFIRRRGFSGK